MISPVFLVVIFIAACSDWHQPSYGSVSYPPWAHTIGWVLMLVSVIQIPFWLFIMTIVSLMEGGSWSTFHPTSSWLARRNEANSTFIYKPDQSIHSIDSFIKPPFACHMEDTSMVSVSTLPLPPTDQGRAGMDCSTAKRMSQHDQPAICLTDPPQYDKAMSYQYFCED